MYVMSAKDTSKGWCYYGEHIGMDAACSTVFSRFHNSRRKNIFLSDHGLGSAHHPSNNNGHHSAGRSVGAPQPRRLSSIFPRREMVARAALENSDSVAYSKVCRQGHYSAGDRRYAVSSQRQKSQRRGILARCGSFDQNQNRLRMGFESCRADFAGSTSMGRRAAGLAYQHAGASQERKIAYRTGCRNARRSRHLVGRQEDSRCGRRFLRVAGWVGHNEHDNYIQAASRCVALQFAAETKTSRPRRASKARSRVAQTQVDGFACSQMDTGKFYRSWQYGYAAGLFSLGAVVQCQQDTGAACYLAGSERQRAGRLFFYDRCVHETRRGIGRLRRPVGYRGYIQKHQTASWRGTVADMGQARPRASGGIGTLAVFDGLVLVLPTAWCQTNIPNSAVVCEQNHTQLRRRSASLAKSFVATKNYYDVRELCRT